MKIFTSLIALPLLASVSVMAVANDNPQEDARKMDESTVVRKAVNYYCGQGKRLKVTYGFNKQGLPTYAQAYLSGKNRFMPINLNLSDMVGTTFGDDNNFSLHTAGITSRKYRANIQVQSPSSEIIYKSCSPR